MKSSFLNFKKNKISMIRDHLEDFINNRDLHEDYYYVMEEYSDTLLFQEIIHFMDMLDSEWKTNKGVGFWAAEFVRNIILEHEYLLDEEEHTFREFLENLYVDVAAHYRDTKRNYESVYQEHLVSEFDIHYEEELALNEHLPFEEYMKWYNLELTEFKKEHIKLVTYNFEDDLIF